MSTENVVPHVGCLDRACECVQTELARLRKENARQRKALDRLESSLCHVINRVSTEGRDDDQGHIFLVGKAAVEWAQHDLDGTRPVSPGEPETWPKAVRGGEGMALNINIEPRSPYRPDERVVALRTVGLKGGQRARVAFRAEELGTVIDWLEQAHAALTSGEPTP